MRVLQVNKFWYQQGGTESYVAGVVAELERRGHAVRGFSMQHPENRPAEDADVFVPFVNLSRAGAGLSLPQKVRTTARILYEPRARDGVAEVIRRFSPEIAHVHLFERQLTTAVIHGLARSRLPIVQTFHDYSYVCANAALMKGMSEPCEMECTRKGYQQAVRYRCVKRSRSASALGALELLLRRDVFRYRRHVARFISPSAYLRRSLISGGLEAERVVHLPNYVRAAEYEPRTEPGDYALYVGRLSFEKGLWTLLDAASRVPHLEFRIVGRGPEEEALTATAERRGLSNVRFEGFRQGAELRELYRDALCVVMPSEWPENSPMVAYEAFASGKPLVGTAMGGIPELVDDGRDGRILPAHDAAALARVLEDLAASPEQVREMGERAREKVLARYDVGVHVDRLLELYDGVLRGRRALVVEPSRRVAMSRPTPDETEKIPNPGKVA